MTQWVGTVAVDAVDTIYAVDEMNAVDTGDAVM